jgi:hypothetical protein
MNHQNKGSVISLSNAKEVRKRSKVTIFAYFFFDLNIELGD